MALNAPISMVWTAVVVVIIFTSVSGAALTAGPLVSSATLRVVAGGNATCPWQVSLLDAAGDDGGRQICSRERGVFFEESTEHLAPGEAVPKGYERVGDAGVYKLHIRSQVWHEARATCEREGAHLLVLDSAAEARALRRYLVSKRIASAYKPTFTLHAGFRLDLVTAQGERVTYENWSIGGPKSSFCGQIDNDIWMLYGNCTEWRIYICEYELRERTVSVTPPYLAMPLPTAELSKVKTKLIKQQMGYVPLVGWNRTYVKYTGAVVSWKEAKETCEKDGAQMVTLESDEKADALFAFIQSLNIVKFFIDVKTGRPVTVQGDPLEDKGYQRWIKKEYEETCFISDLKLQYYSHPCNSSGFFNENPSCICQINRF